MARSYLEVSRNKFAVSYLLSHLKQHAAENLVIEDGDPLTAYFLVFYKI